MKRAHAFLMAAVVALAAPGCIFVEDGDPDCYGDYCGTGSGDIAFYWSFELADGSATDSCQLADVARIDTEVYDDQGYLEYSVFDRPCGDLGLVLTDFRPGYYELVLTGVCPLGTVTHEGWFEVWVEPGEVNDYGVLELDYLGPCR